jgi:excisionase family DNA binding protein
VNIVETITAKEAAEKWGISDRRVRILCAAGKIPGTVKQGKSYRIPADAVKPTDGRERASAPDGNRYLKWDNEIVGVINRTGAVSFIAPELNEVVVLYTRGQVKWSPEECGDFLSERVVSRDRRDIERILFRMGLSQYDVPRIAEITRGIHPKDLLWIARTKSERLDAAMTDVFSAVFLQRVDKSGDSVDTPEGYNIKRYGVYNGKYGIYKRRISPLTTDVESEVAVSLLGEKLGVPVCPAVRADQDTVFSTFLYDFSKEYIVHFRRLFDGARSDNEYQNLLGVRPRYRDDIARMILLDFITRQDDRHLSNIAVKISGRTSPPGGAESFYALYDNGRSLFYEDTEEMTRRAGSDPAGYATGFGFAGTYWDYVQEIARERGGLDGLINLGITESDVSSLLTEAGFTGYRFDGALEWILKTLDMIRALCGRSD